MISLFTDIACLRCATLLNEGLDENPGQREKLISLGDSDLVFEIIPANKDLALKAPLPFLLEFLPETLVVLQLKTRAGEVSLNLASSSPASSDPETHTDNLDEVRANCTTVRGNPVSVASLLLSTAETNFEMAQDLSIIGDPEQLSAVVKTLQTLDIDWEARLSTIFGELPAHLFIQFYREVKHWGLDSSERIRETYQNFKNEELAAMERNPLSDLLKAMDAFLDDQKATPKTDKTTT